MTRSRSLHLDVVRAAGAAALLAACLGCAGLRLTLYNASVEKPSNVALYFSVTDRAGNPVPNLQADSFRIYEDGQLISVFESRQTILNPEVAAVHYTLLLLDLSGSVTQSGALAQLQPAVQSFADRVSRVQQVAIYGFDGSPKIFPLMPFTSGPGGVRGVAERLLSVRPRDPSTNLNGAVLEGLALLDRTLQHSSAPLKFGTLVVFTDGTDRAHRVDRRQLNEALNNTQHNVFVIGVGSEINEHELRSIGRTGVFLGREPTLLQQAFDQIALKVEGYTKSFYLLSYCSPARAQEHELRVEAISDKRRGSLTYRFNAQGFGPNCDPNRLPRFDIHHPVAPKGR
ncbi:MAG: VWA domain-containing protein [Myxococcales bacterium]|nr:VWA domain-containing protein [Myxococcota bacterium]MDW8282990.1 VWA domain-containing protein [Myxococcales bacterium]